MIDLTAKISGKVKGNDRLCKRGGGMRVTWGRGGKVMSRCASCLSRKGGERMKEPEKTGSGLDDLGSGTKRDENGAEETRWEKNRVRSEGGKY